MSATDSHPYTDAEKDLARFADAFYEEVFVPFPTVYAAVEAVTETAGNTYSEDGRAFVRGVVNGLQAWLEEQEQ